MAEKRELSPAARQEALRHAEAIRLAVRQAVREHALLGRPVVGTRNGQIVWLTPEEILAEVGRTEALPVADSKKISP